MAKIERKYLAHFIDAGSLNFGKTPAYTRIGKDLEEYIEELNPDVETKKNILGEQSVNHNGYEVSSEVDPFYADPDDPLYEPLEKIVNERLTGDACKTTKIDVYIEKGQTSGKAYREDVYIIPNSVGGDTSGVQIPFGIYNAGNRTEGIFDLNTKRFTEKAAA